MIKQYEKELLSAYKKRSPLLNDETVEKTTSQSSAVAAVQMTEKASENPTPEESLQQSADAEKQSLPFEEPSSEAAFSAKVSTGSGAYPVEGAKVIIKKDGRLYAFLTTDRNGETPSVVLPAFPSQDSLSPQTARVVEYTADVVAEGFEEKNNLAVNTVGSTEVFLLADLIPLQERMN
ncbi:MAG: hypothetical protein U0M02_12995, partial [Acutalibacteraceae bacterium]|nr:hypothetical protein [Acutalibacteraceae bacterium]